jgi:hypothetical protein
VIVVVVVVTLAHWTSVPTGWFQDDHAHLQHLREAGWSLPSIIAASRLEFVGEILDLWGRPAVELRFFRPVAFWIMKATYTVVGWQPAPMHVVSLLLHTACCLLVGVLAYRCLGSWLWATFAAIWMAGHPGHVATVQWIACQTELLTTLFLLVGVLAYGRYAHWGDVDGSRQPWFWPPVRRSPATVEPGNGKSTVYLFITLMCYALALGCRENAILFPFVCWSGDRLIGSGRRRWFRWEHGVMAAMLLLYFLARKLAGFEMELPGRPYCVPPGDPGFVAFVLNKAVYYALGVFFFIPVVPMGGLAFLPTQPLWFYGGFAGVIVFVVGVWLLYDRCRALWWPMVWLACFFAPLLPVFASSHHLYLPSVGVALLGAAFFAVLDGVLRDQDNSVGLAQRISVRTLALLYIAGIGALAWTTAFCYKHATLTEDILVKDVLQRGPKLKDGDHLFFINMPLLAYCAGPAIENETELEIEAYALTFSPWIMRMQSPGEVEVLDRHRIRVRAPADGAYLAGISGRMYLEAMGIETIPAQDVAIDAGEFTVLPTQVDETGVRELIFTFDRPLDSPDYHFYFGSPQFLGYPLDKILGSDSFVPS